jgi:hypothetical protein
MIESQALRNVLMTGACSVPLGVQIWVCFKRHILEKDEERTKLERLDSSDAKVRNILNVMLRKFGPFHLRKQSRKVQECASVLLVYCHVLFGPAAVIRVSQDPTTKGLRLQARKNLRLEDLKAGLYGLLSMELSQKDFSALRTNNYPSLFHGNKILFGPLSLINHSCDAPFSFGNPSHTAGVPEELGEFPTIRLKQNSAAGKAAVVIKKDQELKVKYGMSAKNFKCACPKCAAAASPENNIGTVPLKKRKVSD